MFSVALSLLITIFLIHNAKAIGRIEGDYEYPEVQIPQGKLRGIKLTTYRQRVVHGFMAIPFAQPPIRNLRFRAPLPAPAWNGTLNTTEDANMCTQVSKGSVVGDEDCLYLNVYTPQIPSTESKLLPVMVWIYGGGFVTGSGISTETDPTYIMDRDVILVTPNYRLGPLGYLSTGDAVAPGNYALKDKVLALKWVRDNILYFGGDPHRVTIFGISSGAASVNLLAMSDLTDGLFHRYIQISGSALSPWAFVPRSTLARHSYKLGEFLGCPVDASTSLINCLREFNASHIVGLASLAVEWDMDPVLIWMPTDEPKADGAFLTDSPANLYAERRIRDLPCISGVVRDEAFFYTKYFYGNQSKFDDLLKNIDNVLPSILLYKNQDDASARTAAFKAYYFNDSSADRNLLLDNLTQLMTDALCFYPVYSAHRRQFSLGQSPQYLYSFEYKGSFQSRIDASAPNSIEHADDECFLFPIREFCCKRGLSDCDISESDFKMIDIIVDLWTSFATNGTPTVSSSESAVTWEPFSTEDNYLRIGNGADVALEMKNSFFKDRMRLWDDFTSKKLDSEVSIMDFTGFCSATDRDRCNVTMFEPPL